MSDVANPWISWIYHRAEKYTRSYFVEYCLFCEVLDRMLKNLSLWQNAVCTGQLAFIVGCIKVNDIEIQRKKFLLN